MSVRSPREPIAASGSSSASLATKIEFVSALMIYAASYFPPHCLVDEHATPVEYVSEVLGVGGAIKIQSGAGSGKTTLVARIAKRYVASFILFCSFTSAALTELK